MGIFKNREFLKADQLKKSLLLRNLYNRANKILLVAGLLFNGAMLFLMVEQGSFVGVLFLLNIYFLAMIFKGRKLKVV